MKFETNGPAARAGILALSKFGREAGVDSVTLWRWRKRGWLETVNIAGRRYVTSDGLAEFQRRAAAGEFAQLHPVPRRAASTSS
jgi:hypothetical protein